MLECLALENNCIKDAWNWTYENWSWGFFIAVLSLWFTAKAIKKTDKANKLAEVSLGLTRTSTKIAEESLQAAKQSIDTSVELYEKQKNDDEKSRQFINGKKLSAKKKIIENEIIDCYMKYMGFYNICQAIKSRSNFDITLGCFAKSIVIAIDNERNDGVRSLIYLPNLDFSNEFLDELYFLDEPLAEKISSLKGHVFRCSNLINHIVGCIEQFEDDYEFLKRFVKKFEYEIDAFKYELEKVYKLCSPDEVSLEDKHKLYTM